jgi:hypothetical protein
MKFAMNRFLSVVFLVLFVSGSALGQPHANTDANNASQPEAVKHKPESKPTEVTGGDTKAGSEHKEEQCRYKEPGWFTEFYCFFALHDKFWVSFGTLVLAAFTTILGIATAILAYATRRLVDGADDTAQRQLRAYVFPQNSEIRKFGSDQSPEGWVEIRNTGNTPAYKLQRRGGIMLTPFPAQRFPEHDWTTPSSKSDLGPGGEVYLGPITFPNAFTREQIARVVSGESAIYLWGEIRYIDAFKQPRTTKFRHFYRGNGTAQYGTVPTVHDNEGNESD